MYEELFLEKFEDVTNHKFDGIIKLSGVTYYQSKFLLHLDFISEYEKFQNIQESDREELDKALSIIFPKDKDSQFTYEYEIHSTHADDTSVYNLITKFFGKTNEMILKYLNHNPDALKILMNKYEIEITFTLETPLFCMLSSSPLKDRLKYYLEHNFMQDFLISVNEIKVELDNDESVNATFIETSAESGNIRAIDYICKDKVFSKFNILSITKRAQFIIDAKPNHSSDRLDSEIVLCGKISNFAMNKYKNKNYGPEFPDEPEEKIRVNFMLDDTTGKMNCVVFPSPKSRTYKSQLQTLNLLHDGEEVVCIGSISDYNGNVSYSVAAIFNADIDYNSIVLDYVKPTPKSYKLIFPEKFTYERVASLLEDESTTFNTNTALFKDKTYVIFDIECTGKNVMQDEIIEIAAIKVVNGKETESFKTFVNPKIHIPDELTEKVHHISDDMVKNEPTIDEVLDDFYLFTRNSILVGHNIDQFDYPFVNKYMQKAQYKFNNPTFDTLVMSRKLFANETNKFDLASLVKHFNLDNDSPHRAFSDVCATFDVMKVIGKYLDK